MEIKDEDLVIEEDVTVEENNIEEEVIEKSDTSEESEPATIQDEDEEDRIVSIGDPVPEEEKEEEQHNPELVKKLRKVTRGLEKKNKALQRQIEANKSAAETEKPVELGEKPTLANCKYDDVKYEQEILAYDARKRKVEDQAAQKTKTVEEQNKNWQVRQEKYVSLKQEHSFKDFQEAEETVSATFSQAQQSIIVQGAEDSALLVYALGKNPKKLEELAKITDPVTFAFKVAKLETQLKVSNKKAPPPEGRVKATKAGGTSGNTDKVLERLMTEAEKTGVYTAVAAYNRKLRNKDK